MSLHTRPWLATSSCRNTLFQLWMQWTIRVLLVAVFVAGTFFSSAREQPRGIDTEPIRSLDKTVIELTANTRSY